MRVVRLAGALAVGWALAFALHHLDPAWPFPLSEPFAAATAGAAAALAVAARFRLGPDAQRIGALVVAGLALHAGLPGAHNATFPWIELGRSRYPEWEDVALGSLLVSLAFLSSPPTRSVVSRGISSLATLAAVAALGFTLFGSIKYGFQGIDEPKAGMTTVPVLSAGEPVAKRWTRSTVEGSAVRLFPAILRDEWALMDIAGGVQQQAERSGGGALVAVHTKVRYGLWRGLQGVVALALATRIVALGAAAVVFGASLLDRPLRGAARTLTNRTLLAALLLVPVANLVSLALSMVTFLPDDRVLWLPALASSAAFLGVVALVRAAAGRTEGLA